MFLRLEWEDFDGNIRVSLRVKIWDKIRVITRLAATLNKETECIARVIGFILYAVAHADPLPSLPCVTSLFCQLSLPFSLSVLL